MRLFFLLLKIIINNNFYFWWEKTTILRSRQRNIDWVEEKNSLWRRNAVEREKYKKKLTSVFVWELSSWMRERERGKQKKLKLLWMNAMFRKKHATNFCLACWHLSSLNAGWTCQEFCNYWKWNCTLTSLYLSLAHSTWWLWEK